MRGARALNGTNQMDFGAFELLGVHIVLEFLIDAKVLEQVGPGLEVRQGGNAPSGPGRGRPSRISKRYSALCDLSLVFSSTSTPAASS